jgi:hypothetical protein
MTLRFKLPPGGDVPPVTAARRMDCRLMHSAMHYRNLSRVAFHGLTKQQAISISMRSTPGAVPAIHIFSLTAWTLAKIR